MSDEQKKTKLSKEELEKLKKLTNLENPPVKQDTQPLLQTSQEKQIIDTIHKDITILENNNSSIPSKQQDVDSIKKEIQKHFGYEVLSSQTLPKLTHTFTHFKLHIQPQLVYTLQNHLYKDNAHLWLSLEDAMGAAIPTPVRKILSTFQS